LDISEKITPMVPHMLLGANTISFERENMDDKAKAILVFNGHEYKLNLIMAQSPTAPRIEITVKDLIPVDDPLFAQTQVKINGVAPELKKNQIIVTKIQGKFAILLGDVTEENKNGNKPFTVTLISSHAMKQARVLADVEEAPSSPVLNPVMDTRNARQFRNNYERSDTSSNYRNRY